MSEDILSFDIQGIMDCQKNRYPMLFIDRVTECLPGRYSKGYKLFTYNEWYFHGYETASPKVWNAIQVEAMSQMFLMTFLAEAENRGRVAMSNKFDNVNFYRKIVPGEKLELEATLNSFGRGVARGHVTGSVNNEPACSMDCTIVVPSLFGIDPVKLSETNSGSVVTDQIVNPNIDFGIKEIQECLLNKYPWLYIDYVKDLSPGNYVKAVKNFTFNEHFFPSHFPGAPSVPGFIQIETCMQAFLLTFLSIPDYKRKETADRGLRNVRVMHEIVPGDSLDISAVLKSFKRGIATGYVESFVNGKPAISFEVTAVVVEELEKFSLKMK